MTKTTLFLVRHGRTTLNAQGRYRGHLDPPLDERGLEQADTAARQIAPAEPAAVCASPLQRTVQTANAIAARAGCDVTTSADLIDLDYGQWEGLTPQEAERAHPEDFEVFRSDPLAAAAPGGERVTDVEARVMRSLHELANGHAGETIVAVTHELPIRLVLSRLHGVGGPEFWGRDIQPGSVTRLTVEDGRIRIAEDDRDPEATPQRDSAPKPMTG